MESPSTSAFPPPLAPAAPPAPAPSPLSRSAIGNLPTSYISYGTGSLSQSLLMGSNGSNDADTCQTYNCCGLELGSIGNLLDHYEKAHAILPSTNASDAVDSLELDSDALSYDSDSSTQSTSTNGSRPTKRRHLTSSSTHSHHPSNLHAYPKDQLGSLAATRGSELKKRKHESMGGPALTAMVETYDATSGSVNPSTAAAAGPSSSSIPSSAASLYSVDFPSVDPSYPREAPSIPNPPGLVDPAPFAPSPSTSSTDPSVLGELPGYPSDAPLPSLPDASVPSSYALADTKTKAASRSHKAKPSAPIQKSFHCPTPGCQKSYKQQNGLKYHLKIGQCNFEVRDAVEKGLSEAEAEEKSRPYLCKVGEGCTKRYRQMNGLRYHYLNSGAHGAIGMAMIAEGRHENPKAAGSALTPGSWVNSALAGVGAGRKASGSGSRTPAGAVAGGGGGGGGLMDAAVIAAAAANEWGMGEAEEGNGAWSQPQQEQQRQAEGGGHMVYPTFESEHYSDMKMEQ